MRRPGFSLAFSMMLLFLCVASNLGAARLPDEVRKGLDRAERAARAGRHEEAVRGYGTMARVWRAHVTDEVRLRMLMGLAGSLAELGREKETRDALAEARELAPRSGPLARLERRLLRRLRETRVEEDRRPSTVELAVIPSEAELLLDGVATVLPKGGRIELVPGRHVLEFRHEGYDSQKKVVKLGPGETLRLELRLHRISELGPTLFREAGELIKAGRYAQAVPILKRGALDGHGECARSLGGLYLNGHPGVPKSMEQALLWYRMGMRNGDAVCRVKWEGLKRFSRKR